MEWILFLILLCGFYGFSCVDLWILYCRGFCGFCCGNLWILFLKLFCGVGGFLSDAATQVMASHHDGVTRLLKPWWPKMIDEPKAMSPSQWLAIEDGPDMVGWYIHYDENGLATLEEY